MVSWIMEWFDYKECLPKIKRMGSSSATIVIVVVLVAAGAFFFKDRLFPTSKGGQPPMAQMQAPTPTVVVAQVEASNLALSKEFVGKVEAIQTVDLLPQVAGEILQVHFKEGSLVKAGQLLFSLDSQEYKATVDLRRADLAKAKANHDRAKTYYARLKAADVRSVSAVDLDTARNDLLQAEAGIAQAQAALRLAEINLEHTRIKAPISGQIGKATFTKGNYVSAATPPLATITQVDPIRVVFALPDKDYLDQIKAFKSSKDSVFAATLRLANDQAYAFKGVRDFEDNQIDESTGSMMVRLRFKNADALLVPGAMVRVESKPIKPQSAILIPQEALLADTLGDYVYVIDKEQKTDRRNVKLGSQFGNKQEIVSGLNVGETIVVSGIQALQPGIAVETVMLGEHKGSETPAEKAKESIYDATSMSDDAVSGDTHSADVQKNEEGKK